MHTSRRIPNRTVCAQFAHSLRTVCAQFYPAFPAGTLRCTLPGGFLTEQRAHSLRTVCTQFAHSLHTVCAQFPRNFRTLCTQFAHTLRTVLSTLSPDTSRRTLSGDTCRRTMPAATFRWTPFPQPPFRGRLPADTFARTPLRTLCAQFFPARKINFKLNGKVR